MRADRPLPPEAAGRPARPRPVVAVVPFGARATRPEAGAWARQIARRLVDRFARESALELRPVFLVAMPEAASEAGYLVFGSSPTPELAAQYAASLDATRALAGTYREDGAERSLALTLVDAATRGVVASTAIPVPPGELALVETAAAHWLVERLGVEAPAGLATPAAANEDAYAALLAAMDEEVNATLFRPSDPARGEASLAAAVEGYLRAIRADPDAAVPEERLLVVAAESLERGSLRREIAALEELITLRPRSWRAHYILGRLRAEAGEASAAIIAFEHAHALHPLPDADLVRLAELYANTGAIAPGLAHLRRIAPESAAYADAQELTAIVAFQRGDIDAGVAAFARARDAGAASWELHASYGAALHARGELDPATARYREALAAGAPGVVRLNLARVLLARGERERALDELDQLVDDDRVGEVAGHARRLRFGLREPDLERDLEQAGRAALAGDATALEEAARVFERALAADADLWEARFGLGIVARQRGDAAAAETAFRGVLELWPDQPEALHELGVALLMGERTQDALAALDRAAALRPDDAAYVADAGFAHLRAGELQAARRQLERAARLDASDPITKSYLGELARVEERAGRT